GGGEGEHAHGTRLRSERPGVRTGGTERRVARPPDSDGGRGDRPGLPLAARGRRTPRTDPRPGRGGARAAASPHSRPLARSRDPPPRRLPPWPDLVAWQRLDPARLRGRARADARRAPAQAFA